MAKKQKRIHVAKEWGVSKSSRLADLINGYLGDRAECDPRVTDIHPILIRTPLLEEETRMLVVFELGDCRKNKEPYAGRERRRRIGESYLVEKRNGGGEVEASEPLKGRRMKQR